VTRDRVLARSERVQSPVHHALRGRLHAHERQDVAEPERLQDGQVQPAGRLRDVLERVGALIAVLGGVG
jgi:hypothetical protein